MVGPLDSQIVINQSTATEKVQEVQQRHPDLQQKQFALQFQEERERRQRDVVDTERLDQVVIRNREKREEKPKKRRQSQAEGSLENEEKLIEACESGETGARVDIFV
jgi:hypothetical protein